MAQALTDRTRKRIFALAREMWPGTPHDAVLTYARSVAEHVNPKGGASVSALNELQGQAVATHIQVAVQSKREHDQKRTREQWQNDVLDKHPQDNPPGFATVAQMKRLVAAAVDAGKSPAFVLGIRKRIRKTELLTWDFPTTSDEIQGVLKAVENERRDKRSYYYDSNTRSGKGPVRRKGKRRKEYR